MRWLIGLFLLLGAGAFWDGLYAPAQQLAGTVGFGIVAVGIGGLAGPPVFLTWGEMIGLSAISAAALLSLLAPVAAGTAAHGPLIVAGWLLAYYVGRRLAGAELLERALCWLWALLGPTMVFGGLAALSYLPAHHSGRLAAFLGYPIAVGVLGLLGLAGTLPMGGPWAPVLCWGNLVAVLLSGSRGVWAVGLLLAAYLGWARRDLLRPLWLPAVAALATALWVGPAVAARTVWPALLPFLLIGLTVLLATRFPRHPFAVGWSLAAALAPGWGWLLGRAAALPLTEGSSVERMTFLADGFRLARSLPLGAGLKAWTALQLQGASYSYYSAEVHSAPLDVTLAFGWLGGLAFLALLGRFLLGLAQGRAWSTWRLGALAGLGALGVHALLDWDLSYALFALPLWLGFGLCGAPGTGRRWPQGAAAALAGLATAGALLVGAGDVATELSARALAAGRPAEAARHATLAVAVTPWNDLAQAGLGQALSAQGRRDRALAAFAAARRLGPREPWYAELQARELAAAGRRAEAAAAYRAFTALWPWYVPAYEAALSAHLDMALQAELAGDLATAEQVAASARTILAQLDRQRAIEPAGRPRRPMQTETPVILQARSIFKG